MNPLLSVVVPAYGVAEYLPACLDSILAQTLQDLEVIVVDDGSLDECGEIADSFARFDDRVRVLHTENQGLGPARNTGADEARGKYITFADSDDLIPPRAYELLVSSLEATGSDIAAGNAWRHIDGRGNVPSWTHRLAFGEYRKATHIGEFPLLVRDRMIWNKVFRREFWTNENFRFPNIRYEDFPVTFAAHLAAKSVDVFPDKVYMWRERLAETSITQKSLELDNIRDRVVSAEMVLDIADRQEHQLRSPVHAYFIEVDLVTLATAIATAEDEHRAEFVQLALRLARRLGAEYTGVPKLARLIHKSLLSGDIEIAAAMARWRQTGDKGELVRGVSSRRGLRFLPSLADAITRRSGSGLIRDRKLKCTMVSSSRIQGAHEVRVQIVLRGTFLSRAKMKAELQTKSGAVPLDFTFDEVQGRNGFLTVRVPDQQVDSLCDESARLVVRCQVSSLTWQGGVQCPRSKLPGPERSASGRFIVVADSAGGSRGVWFRSVDASSLATAELLDDRLVISVAEGHRYVAVLRPQPTPPLVSEVREGRAILRYEDIIADPADDPTTSRAYRAIVSMGSGSRSEARSRAVTASEMMTEAFGSDLHQHLNAAEQERERAAASIDETIAMNAGADVAAGSETHDGDGQPHIERAGVEELVWLHDIPNPVEYRGHKIELCRSGTGNAEILHEVVDHFIH